MGTRWKRWGRLIGLTAAIALIAAVAAPAAWAAPGAPAGMTPFAQDDSVVLAWQSTPGASSYVVVRGTTPTNLNTFVNWTMNTSVTDGSVTNGTTYYYAVYAVSGTGASPSSTVVSARPRARTCATGNPTVVENCFPGTTAWKVPDAVSPEGGGLEGFTTRSSIAAGEAVDLKVRAPVGAPYRVEVYRTGWYGGDQGRLIGTLNGYTGTAQPDCVPDYSTGEVSCGDWSSTATVTTTAAWPSGVYVLKLVRTDNNAANFTVLTVRNDTRVAPIGFVVPSSTYQAYNAYGGRSLYSWNSSGPPTVTGAARAAKVSYDRPYWQTTSGHHDFYTVSDVQLVGWLERQGYDVSFLDSTDLNAGRGQLNARDVVVIGSHDEYVSSQMRAALTSARNAGVSLAVFGANTAFWKARFDSSATTGQPDRTLVVYKTTESGPPDPSGIPTTTWRDPAGANQPENALFGGMYVGDNGNASFPMFVTAEQGKNRTWRYTPLASLAPGSRAQIAFTLVGWEWDRRVDNGQEPAGVQTLSASPVSGNILQDAGHIVYSPGSEVAEATRYVASSGATVFNAGTNSWNRGLGNNMYGSGEPDSIIQQATANLLSDMGQRPTTPAGVTLDAAGALQISNRTPASGATGVAADSAMTVAFDRALDPTTVTGANVTLTRAATGDAVAGTVEYVPSSQSVRFTPDEALDGFTQYRLTVTTGVKGWNGAGLAAPSTWTFITSAGTAPVVTARTPAAGADRIGFGTTVTATLNRSLDPDTVTGANVSLTSAGGAVPAAVTYDAAARRVVLTPNAPLASNTTYTARLTTGLTARDGTPLAADQTWSFTTYDAVTVTSHTPAALASGISPNVAVSAQFSRSLDPGTLTSSTFTLTQGATAVPATISYDASRRIAMLVPNAPLAAATTYMVSVRPGVTAFDGAPLGAQTSWSFATALVPPPPPAVTSTSPAGSATDAPIAGAITATFDTPLDPVTLSPSSFTLRKPGGATIAADVSYDAATRTASLTPVASLDLETTYEVRVASSVRSSVGAPLAADITWSFTTGGCPCSVMPTLAPQEARVDVRDARPGSGPFTLEVGTKIAVDRTMKLSALRFYKAVGENGTHVGRVWTAGGGLIASTTFTGESASGWQQQALASPVTLRAGRTYVVSVGVNTFYVSTRDGLATALVAGPLHTVADGLNGVFAESAGDFPTESWRTSNYFVDAVVEEGPAAPTTPAITEQWPLDGAAGVSRSVHPRADFNVPLDPATVSSSTFTVRPLGGSPVAATVTYDESLRRAKVAPTAPLAASTVYVARLTSGVTADDGTPIADTTWQFTTASNTVPQVTSTSPTEDADLISTRTQVRATFAAALDPATVTAANVTVTGPGGAVAGAVSYDSATRTAIFAPSAPLAGSTSYTATIGTGVQSSTGVPLALPFQWRFTTSDCPCQLMAPSDGPSVTGRPVADGRSGPGPFSYEMGLKVRVSQPAELTAIRFYKSPGEAGTHVGRLWTSTGTQLASVTFGGESGSGWQQQALASPVSLTPGQTYVVTVGINDFYVVTSGGLGGSLVSGPLASVADGANGVFGPLGTFPTDTWGSSNYYIDAVVR